MRPLLRSRLSVTPCGLRRRGRQMPGRRVRRSAAIVFVAVGFGPRLGYGRLVPGGRMRRSAAIIVVSFGIGLALDRCGRVCHRARSWLSSESVVLD